MFDEDSAIGQTLGRRLTAELRFSPRAIHMEIVLGKVARSAFT
jgi:hypothetical protein